MVTPENVQKQAQAAEMAFVGSILSDPSIIPTINVTVHREYFSSPIVASVWQAMLDLELEGKPIDNLTVLDQINKLGEPVKPSFLVALMENAPVAQNVANYGVQIIENYVVRRAAETMAAAIALGATIDLKRVISDLQNIDDIRCVSEAEYMEWGQVGREIVDKLKNGAVTRSGYLPQSSYPQLNDMAPLHKGELCIVGAIESGGKTAFAVNLCLGLAKHGSKGIYFFYESTAENLHLRIASITTGIPLDRIRKSDLTAKEIDLVNEEMSFFSDELVYKDESQKGAIDDLIGHVRQRIKKHPCDYIVIDHMHQMPISGNIREGFIDISRKFLALAKQENICVIALAQFRKPTERELDKRPHRGMIRESSSIAQDAHHIWFLHDPLYLDEKRQEQDTPANKYLQMAGKGRSDSEGASPKHAEIIIDKNREGQTGVIPAQFKRECVYWKEI